MSLSAATPQPEAGATSVALLLGDPRVVIERFRAEARLCHAQHPKGKGNPAGAAGSGSATPPTAAASQRRVLVVDDEALVRRMLSLFLIKAGFAVTAVESAEAALDLLRAGEACDLLVTDQSMPGMTGCELVGEAARLYPGLPALVVTGYDIAGGLERLPRGVPILRKPLERTAFVGQVRALLGFVDPDAGAGV